MKRVLGLIAIACFPLAAMAAEYMGVDISNNFNFARPGIEIEIQAVGVIGDRCSSENPCSAEGQAKKR